MELIRDTWTQYDYSEFIEYIKSIADDDYKAFSQKLTPNTPNMYGIRVPIMRNIAKQIGKGNFHQFLDCIKSDYHEEIIIEGLVMTGIKCSYEEMLSMMKAFSGKIYNWAISDTVVFKGLKKYPERYIDDCDWFIYNDNPWIKRYGFGGLMNFCICDEYIEKVLKKVDSVNSDHYYVEMMQAWLLATAMAKLRDKTLSYLENNNLNNDTMNMTIRKICDSYRISDSDKMLVRKMKKN